MADLVDAVSRLDLAGVNALLAERGRDPNAARSLRCEEAYQPDTPLKMVVFRLSDDRMTDDGRAALGAIARALLARGADPAPAMALAEDRYGPYPGADAAGAGDGGDEQRNPLLQNAPDGAVLTEA